MKKTSVYLPEELKDRLALLARRTGRSEAQLLRTAVERLVADEPSGRAAGGAGRAGRPDPAGRAGPRRGRRRPRRRRARDPPGGGGAAPGRPSRGPHTSAMAVGRAEAVVRDAAPGVAVERVELRHGGRHRRPGGRARRRRRPHRRPPRRGRAGGVRDARRPQHLQHVRVAGRRGAARRPDVPIEVVPGIMAFQDLAARTATVLVDGDRAPRARPRPRVARPRTPRAGRGRPARRPRRLQGRGPDREGGGDAGRARPARRRRARRAAGAARRAGWRRSPRSPTGRPRTWRRSSRRRCATGDAR